MTEPVSAYIRYIEIGSIPKLLALLSMYVQGAPPTYPEPMHDREMIALGLGCVSSIINNFYAVRTYEAGDGWHAVVFAGTIDEETVQFSDHVHVGADQLIDQLEIFIRPTTLAERFYGKLASKMQS